ncbi:hypothetical protein AB9K21_00470 [Anaplasma phagocytophilum]
MSYQLSPEISAFADGV